MLTIEVVTILVLLAGAEPVEAPERPPDELIELLRDVELLDDYGDLLDLETDDEPAPGEAPVEPSKPPDTPGVNKGRNGRP